MALFLLVLLIAVALGIVGVAMKGLLYVFAIGVVVLILDLVWLGFRHGRGGRRPAR
jgi:hypothetical protein